MVSRNPKDYHPTVHCTQRSRDRGIDYEHIAETIREGDVDPAPVEDTFEFRREFEEYDNPLKVVANTDGRIVTAVVETD